MSFLRALWNWTSFALAGLFAAVVLLAAPLTSVFGSGPDSADDWVVALVGAWAVVTLAGAAASKLSAKGKELKPLEKFGNVVSLLLLVGVLGTLGRAVLSLAPNGGQTAFARFLDRVFDPTWAALGGVGDRIGVPPDLAGIPTAPLALFTLLFFGRNAISWRIDKLRRGTSREGVSLPSESRSSQQTSDEARERAKAVERRIAVASYTEAKSLLQAFQMELTFVSLDIVGSTGMKQGEDPYVVEQCFGEYRKLVERVLRQHGACKQVWTPDGQMAAFRSAQAGVDCAKEVLQQLPGFNDERSRLKRPFRIRAGANIGKLSTDDRTPMEQISDFSIDVAGHMQKYADPDSLWISEELYERLEDSSGFAATGKEVDGRKVFAWKIEA
jgi:class 3 adenylate cyclase